MLLPKTANVIIVPTVYIFRNRSYFTWLTLEYGIKAFYSDSMKAYPQQRFPVFHEAKSLALSAQHTLLISVEKGNEHYRSRAGLTVPDISEA